MALEGLFSVMDVFQQWPVVLNRDTDASNKIPVLQLCLAVSRNPFLNLEPERMKL